MFYYFDPRDWIEAPGRVAWYGANDKERGRARFVWKAVNEPDNVIIAQPGEGVSIDANTPYVVDLDIDHSSQQHEGKQTFSQEHREAVKEIIPDGPSQAPDDQAVQPTKQLAFLPEEPEVPPDLQAPYLMGHATTAEVEEDVAAPGCGPGWYPPPGLTCTAGKPVVSSPASGGSTLSFFRSGRFGLRHDPGIATPEEVAWQQALASEERLPSPTPPGVIDEAPPSPVPKKAGRNKIRSSFLTKVKAFSFGSSSFRPPGRVPSEEHDSESFREEEARGEVQGEQDVDTFQL